MPYFESKIMTKAGIPLQLHMIGVIDALMDKSNYREPTRLESNVIEQCLKQLESDIHELRTKKDGDRLGWLLLGWQLIYVQCQRSSHGIRESKNSINEMSNEEVRHMLADWLTEIIERIEVYQSLKTHQFETNERWVRVATFLHKCYSSHRMINQMEQRGTPTSLKKYGLINSPSAYVRNNDTARWEKAETVT